MTDAKTVVVRLEAITSSYMTDMKAAAGTTATAASMIDGSMRKAGTTMSGIGSDMTRKLTPAALALGVTFGLAFHQFQGGQDALRTETGATGKALDGLTTSMRNVGSEVPESLDAVGKAMGIIADRTGLTGKPLEDLTRQLLQLQHMGQNLDVDTMTRMFNDWGIATDHQSASLDTLYRVSQLTGTGVDVLATDVVKFGAPLRTLGYDFQTSAALIGQFEKEGVNTTAVMMGMRVAMATFAKAGQDPKVALQAMIDKIRELGPGVQSTNLAMSTFGRRGGADMLRAILEGKVGVDELTASLAHNTDTVSQGAQATYHFGERLAMWKNDIVGALGPMSQWGMVAAGMVAISGPMVKGLGGVITAGAAVPGLMETAALKTMYLQESFVALVAEEGVLGATTTTLTAIMGSNVVAMGLGVAALAGITIAFKEASDAADRNQKSFNTGIDWTNFAAAGAKIDEQGRQVDELGKKFQTTIAGYTGFNDVLKLADPAGWETYLADSAQYEENLKHITAENVALGQIGEQLGISGNAASHLAADLHIDPTTIGLDRLVPVMQDYANGTIDAAEAQRRLDTATNGATKRAREQAAADADSEKANQQQATAARGVFDAQRKIVDATRAQEDAAQKYQDVQRQGADLTRAERAANLDLISAEQALQDEKEKIAGIPRQGAQASLDLRDANLGVLDAQANLDKVTKDSTSTDLDKQHAQLQLEQAQLRVQDATQRVSDVQKEASRSGTDLAKAELGVQDAQAKVQSAHDLVTKHTQDLSRAQDDLRTAYLNSTEAATALAVAEAILQNQGALTAGQTAALEIPQLEALASTLAPDNPLRTQLQGYIDSLSSIPGAVPTSITVDTSQAHQALFNLAADFASIPGSITHQAPNPLAGISGFGGLGGRAAGGGVGPGWSGEVAEAGHGPELLTIGSKTMLMMGGQPGMITAAPQFQALQASMVTATHQGQAGGRGDYVHKGNIVVYGNQPESTARSVIMEQRKAAVLGRIR